MRTLIKYIFIIGIAINATSTTYGQRLVESIDNAYKSLDEKQYVIDLKKPMYECCEEYANLTRCFIPETVVDSLEIVNIEKRCFDKRFKRCFDEFIYIVKKSRREEFALNLRLEKDTAGGSNCYSFKPDTRRFPFRVYFYGRFFRGKFSVCVVPIEKGEYVGYIADTSYDRRILKREIKVKPKYLLYCEEFFENLTLTIWYVFNDKIYVYRDVEKKAYELDEYVELFFKLYRDKRNFPFWVSDPPWASDPQFGGIRPYKE